MGAIFWTVGMFAALFALHLLALWMERRGWIFYKHTRASSTARSNAFMSVQGLFEPSAEHAVERRSFDDVDEADSGVPREPEPTEDR